MRKRKKKDIPLLFSCSWLMAHGSWLMAHGFSPSRHRIVASAAQWMAAQEASPGEPHAAKGAVGGQCFNGVLRAGREVAAVTSEIGAQGRLVEANRENQDTARKVEHSLRHRVAAFLIGRVAAGLARTGVRSARNSFSRRGSAGCVSWSMCDPGPGPLSTAPPGIRPARAAGAAGRSPPDHSLGVDRAGGGERPRGGGA